MDKKEFTGLLKEATKEFNAEKKERFKTFLKERMQEYEMAKATVDRLDKQFKKLQKEGFQDESFLLEYDGE